MDELSAEQLAWRSIACNVRQQLEARVVDMAGMVPQDLHTFLDALLDARWLEEQAILFDKTIDLKLSRGPYDN